VQEFLNGGTAPGHIQVPASRGHKARVTPPPLTSATGSELLAAHGLASSVPFPVYYPIKRVASAASPADYTRAYRLHGGHAYVVVVAEGGLGQYYDLEGSDWKDAPILKDPNQTVQLGGRTMRLYFEGQRVRIVAWRDGRGVYWLVNTLQNILSNRQMLSIAQAAQPVH
jgi:hypothetical protein